MARTGENIYERKDGRYEGRYIASYDEKGKAKYVSVYGKSKAEVREKLRARKGEGAAEPSPLEGKCFREAAELWLSSKKDSIAPTTYDRYSDALARCIYPEYGDTPISHITEQELARFTKSIAEKAEKDGRGMTRSMFQMTKGVLSMVLDFARGQGEGEDLAALVSEKTHYKSLDALEIERVCLCAKHNQTLEMLAVLLGLFCGIRIGEICALGWEDVSLDSRQIYVHRSAHRVKAAGASGGNTEKNAEANSGKKTEIRAEELAVKTQIRRVEYPEILSDYIKSFYKEGRGVLSGLKDTPYDAKTLATKMERTFSLYQIQGVNFQRLRKTYVEGKADAGILQRVFAEKKPRQPYADVLDKKWLTVEMAKDLAPLRLLVGMTAEEVGALVGVSPAAYQTLEDGRREMTWGEYLSFLFLFHYNGKTEGVLESLGLYPLSLKESLKIPGKEEGSCLAA